MRFIAVLICRSSVLINFVNMVAQRKRGGGRWSGGRRVLPRAYYARAPGVGLLGWSKGSGDDTRVASTAVRQGTLKFVQFEGRGPPVSFGHFPPRSWAGATHQTPAHSGRLRGNDGLFTLTLTLSHRGRGDVAPGTGPLGYRRSRAATSGMGVWRRWLRLVGCLGVCGVRGARYRGRCRFRRRWLSLRLRIGRASLWTRTRWARP